MCQGFYFPSLISLKKNEANFALVLREKADAKRSSAAIGLWCDFEQFTSLWASISPSEELLASGPLCLMMRARPLSPAPSSQRGGDNNISKPVLRTR